MADIPTHERTIALLKKNAPSIYSRFASKRKSKLNARILTLNTDIKNMRDHYKEEQRPELKAKIQKEAEAIKLQVIKLEKELTLYAL